MGPFAVAVAVVAAAVIVILISRLSKPGYKRAGDAGEAAASELVRSVLRKGDHQLLNVKLGSDGRTAEMDEVIVNSYGVFVIEVKNYSGVITGGENDREWKKYKTTAGGNVYEENVRNPIPQVRRQVDILARFLKSRGIRVWINGYALLVRGNSPVSGGNILTDADDIDRAIHTCDSRNKMLDARTVEKIVRLLS